MDLTNDSVRKPTEKQLQKFRNVVRSGHDHMGADNDMFDDIAKQLCAGGMQVDEDGLHSAFDGPGLADIRALLGDDEDSEPDETAPENSDVESAAGRSKATTADTPKPKSAKRPLMDDDDEDDDPSPSKKGGKHP